MAWLRIEDTVPEHPKHLKVGPAASWLWLCALAYSQRQLSDGFIPDQALLCLMPEWAPDESQPSNSRVTPESQASNSRVTGESQASHSSVADDDPPLKYPRIRTLAQRLVRAGLFERTKTGYLIHDYHDYNDTRSVALAKKKAVTDQRRTAGLASAAARAKQQNSNGPVERAFNPIPSHPIPVQIQQQALQTAKPSNGNGNGHAIMCVVPDLETAEEALRLRAGNLVQNYAAWFYAHRKGARYRAKPALDFPRALDIVRTWPDDARIEKIAVIVLTTDDQWISGTDRGFGVFAAKATWADDRLTAWEADHGLKGN